MAPSHPSISDDSAITQPGAKISDGEIRAFQAGAELKLKAQHASRGADTPVRSPVIAANGSDQESNPSHQLKIPPFLSIAAHATCSSQYFYVTSNHLCRTSASHIAHADC